jgi:hypothetical protein
MRRVVVLLGFAALAACCTAFAFGGGQPSAFRLADASAACRLDGARLVCANLSVRSGLVLGVRGTPHPVAAHIWWDASTPVLKSWSRGGLTCHAETGTISCRNRSGASISLDGAHIAVAV